MALKNHDQQPSIAYGKYQHYKGGLYEVTGMALDTEDDKWRVLYRDEAGAVTYARPYDMFVEDVTVGGDVVPRFRFLGEVALDN